MPETLQGMSPVACEPLHFPTRAPRVGRTVVLLSTSAVALALLAQPAFGQERLLTLRLTAGLTWDSNLFRVADSAPDPQLARNQPGRGDRIDATTLGIRLAKAYSQQEVSLDFSGTATRYEKFRFLDRDSFHYDGAWRWHFTPRISGALTASRAEETLGFEDTGAGQRVVRVTTRLGSTVDWHVAGGWYLLAGLSEQKSANSQQFLAVPDDRATTAQLGVRYLTKARNSITVTRRWQRGITRGQTADLVNFVDDPYLQLEDEFAATWNLTGRSVLVWRVSRAERRHEALSQRDFSGVSGDVRYTWSPTGKLDVALGAARTVSPFTAGLSSSTRVDETLSVTPNLRVSERVTLRTSLSRRQAVFRGALGPGAGPARQDSYRSVEGGLTWAPHRSATLTATIRHERRRSNIPLGDYTDRVAGLSATLTF